MLSVQFSVSIRTKPTNQPEAKIRFIALAATLVRKKETMLH